MTAIRWRQALGLGFLSWLIPFVFAFPVFPIKQANPPLFDTVMSLAVVVTAAWLGRHYFRKGAPRMGEALAIGFLWLTVNLILDYPMFAYGPMKMSAARYYSEIGAGYLLYPAFLAGAAAVAR
jgi:hypothetical protein